jgi:hypothetical protein
MNTGKRVLLCLLLWGGCLISKAQCVTPLETVSFDSTITGAGNAFHTFNFPKFDAALGTLVEVVVRAEVTLRYRFQLENKESIPINNYRVRVVREDEISGSTLPTPIINTYQTTYGPYALAANDGVAGSGPDYISIGPVYAMNHQMVERSFHNTADYLGSGMVSMDYTATTYSIVFGSVNYNFNGTAEDTVRMTVTYKYCTTWFLPADISSFTATATNNERVDIRWATLNERSNRDYLVEKSSDGRNFSPVTTFRSNPSANATGSYRHSYTPTSDENGKLVFRLKQIEPDGSVKYSALRVVDIRKNQHNIMLYPNPSNGNFNVLFHNTKRNDWKVEVLNLSGQVLKHYEFNRALTGRINLQQELSRGSYFIKVINKKTGEQTTKPLILK